MSGEKAGWCCGRGVWPQSTCSLKHSTNWRDRDTKWRARKKAKGRDAYIYTNIHFIRTGRLNFTYKNCQVPMNYDIKSATVDSIYNNYFRHDVVDILHAESV